MRPKTKSTIGLTCLFWILLAFLFVCERPVFARQKTVILATTTSAQDTGLLDELIPPFEKKTGYTVKTIAVGSGQAMAMARRGEADILLVHSPKDEEAFMNDGFGINRRLLMHNDFIVVGPPGDAAKIRGEKSASTAFKKIAGARSLFISRGDKSGTHARELAIWKKAGLEPEGQKWRIETGLGQGQTLAVASEKGAYTLTDRASFLALKKNLSLELLLEGDPSLLNYYHVIELNPEKFSNKTNREGARAFADFLFSDEAQRIIKNFGVEKLGAPLFIPDAENTEKDAGAG
jgi:tungstate transport system substrate-binding protein